MSQFYLGNWFLTDYWVEPSASDISTTYFLDNYFLTNYWVEYGVSEPGVIIIGFPEVFMDLGELDIFLKDSSCIIEQIDVPGFEIEETTGLLIEIEENTGPFIEISLNEYLVEV